MRLEIIRNKKLIKYICLLRKGKIVVGESIWDGIIHDNRRVISAVQENVSLIVGWSIVYISSWIKKNRS